MQKSKKKRKQLEIETLHYNLEKKKRKLTVVVKDKNGDVVYNARVNTKDQPTVKTEGSDYDRQHRKYYLFYIY